jgi:hypothetical protein
MEIRSSSISTCEQDTACGHRQLGHRQLALSTVGICGDGTGFVIESRTGKYTVVVLLLILAAILATSRPKKPRVVYPLAAVFGVIAAGLAWRVRLARPIEQSFPLGDATAFIVAVPKHVEHLAEWARGRGVSPPPLSVPGMDEWIWSNREALGEEWGRLMHGLVAAYGEAVRAKSPSLIWTVRGGEPALVSPRSFWPGRRVFNEVHDAVFADV